MAVDKYQSTLKGRASVRRAIKKLSEQKRRDPEKWKASYLERHTQQHYGISRAEYEERLKSQDYKCGICGEQIDDTRGKNGKALDHDHATGRLRDFLCNDCNKGLGYFDDSSERLEMAMKYLLRHREVTK